MPKLIFRAALIRYVDLRYDEKAKAKYVKINFTAAFSAPVREAMEWADLPDGYPMAKLDGELNASHFVLTPDDKELRMHELQMDATGMSNFEVHRVKVGEDSTENELRFQVTTSVRGATALLESYIEQFGKGTAALRVNYEQQSELEMDGDKQESFDTQVHADAEHPSAAPLASAASMGEGTHAAKRKPRAGSGTVN
jgi:hypothetical protein